MNLTLGMAIAIAVLVAAVGIQTERLKLAKATHKTFVEQIEAQGKLAVAMKKAKEAENAALKKGLDSENNDLRSQLAAASKRLPSHGAFSGRVPEIPRSAGGSDEAKISVTDINGAIRKHVESVRAILGGTASLIEEGAAAVIDLDTGKDWVKLQAVK